MRPVGIYEKTSEKMLSRYKMRARWGAVTPPSLALTMSVCSVKISDNNLVTTEGNNTGFQQTLEQKDATPGFFTKPQSIEHAYQCSQPMDHNPFGSHITYYNS